MRMRRCAIGSGAIAAIAAVGAPAAAQTSPYYLLAGDQSSFHVIQGGQLIRTWPVPEGTARYQYPIVVTDTVRTMGADEGAVGAEYDLDGNDLGPRFTHPPGSNRSWDGTTDGTSHYSIDLVGRIWRFDQTWQNPKQLFDAGGLGGLTYDPDTDSLWVSDFSTSTITNFSFTGQVITSFDTGHARSVALALDHADGTLWLHDRTEQGTFEQWSRDGERLDRVVVAGMDTENALGGEFPFVICPEDVNNDGAVDFDDLLLLLSLWGPCEDCKEDIDGNGAVDFDDLLRVLSAWGPCGE